MAQWRRPHKCKVVDSIKDMIWRQSARRHASPYNGPRGGARRNQGGFTPPRPLSALFHRLRRVFLFCGALLILFLSIQFTSRRSCAFQAG
ncbi:hypothetical protein PYCCODRAFT_1434928 [Trametes coccinea BRFM310]|uniref:Uncharacterized protein n=1 Tax=Trametes coccinea (strain BRFM310) TaxID=1353009 RepID=A0A1Y2IPJ6_TRAC3|nr:hypothetical protein PYCCODRAFT_1434928 [Trametes coccinea BRFM310]